MENNQETVAAPEVKLDMERINKAQEALDLLRKENSEKEYLVKMPADLFEYYEAFINFDAPWKGKEGLGIIEILKKIDKVKAEGIKNNVIYMNNLHIEATHYFLSKYETKGSSVVNQYIQLYTNIESSLQLVGADNQKCKDLEKELIAAQQGIETC